MTIPPLFPSKEVVNVMGLYEVTLSSDPSQMSWSHWTIRVQGASLADAIQRTISNLNVIPERARAVLPFRDITDEQIREAFDDMEDGPILTDKQDLATLLPCLTVCLPADTPDIVCMTDGSPAWPDVIIGITDLFDDSANPRFTARRYPMTELFNEAELAFAGTWIHPKAVGRDLDVRVARRVIDLARNLPEPLIHSH